MSKQMNERKDDYAYMEKKENHVWRQNKVMLTNVVVD